MRFAKWIYIMFMLLDIGKHNSLAKTDNSSGEVESYNETQNLTLENKKENFDNIITRNGTIEKEAQISDMIRTAHQADTGSCSQCETCQHNNKSINIKIHCCKLNNSVIECKHEDFKYIIKLNSNRLDKDQVGKLVKSIYTFIDELTKSSISKNSVQISGTRPTLNDSENVSMGNNLVPDQMNKFNSSTLPTDSDKKILQSRNNYKNIAFREVKKYDENKTNSIIECSLIKKLNDNSGITSLLNFKQEPMLKLECRLVGNRLIQPKTFTIPVAINYAQSKINQKDKNELYRPMSSLSKYADLDEYTGNSSSHKLRERNCKRKCRHIIVNGKTKKRKEDHINENNGKINKINMITHKYRNNYFTKNNTENNTNLEGNYDALTTEINDTIKSKFLTVKEWMSNLKDKTTNPKKDQNNGDENEKQSQFLFHGKHNNSMIDSETPQKLKYEKKIKKNGKFIDTADKRKQANFSKTNKSITTDKFDKTFWAVDEDESTVESATKARNHHKINHGSSLSRKESEDYDETKPTKKKDFSSISKHTKTHNHIKITTTDNSAYLALDTTPADDSSDSDDNNNDENDNDNDDDDRITKIDSITTIALRTPYFQDKLKIIKSNHADPFSNNKVKMVMAKKEKTIIENVSAKSHRRWSPTPSFILKEVCAFKKEHFNSENIPDKIINGNIFPVSKENINLTRKEVLKYYDPHLSPERLKLFTEDEDEEEENEEEDGHEDDEYEGNPEKTEDTRKIISLKMKNHQLSGLINSSKDDGYKHIDSHELDDNRRKRLFDYISHLKKSKKMAAENYVRK